MFAQVIVDILHSSVDRIYDYSFTEGVYPGCRVVVPFGNKKVDGIVISDSQTTSYPLDKIKQIICVKDSVNALTSQA